LINFIKGLLFDRKTFSPPALIKLYRQAFQSSLQYILWGILKSSAAKKTKFSDSPIYSMVKKIAWASSKEGRLNRGFTFPRNKGRSSTRLAAVELQLFTIQLDMILPLLAVCQRWRPDRYSR